MFIKLLNLLICILRTIDKKVNQLVCSPSLKSFCKNKGF
jgi:hypothetical protein